MTLLTIAQSPKSGGFAKLARQQREMELGRKETCRTLLRNRNVKRRPAKDRLAEVSNLGQIEVS
jgi:hypothetical protein